MSKMKFKVDISGFGAVVNDLSKLSGKGFKATMKAELGHILKTSIQKTPIANTKKIVARTMPEGYKVKGLTGVGKRLVTFRHGKKYHAGQVIKAGKGKRGGQLYLRPKSEPPGQRWMSKPIAGGGSDEEWNHFVEEQKVKAIKRNARKGITAGVFYAMAKKGKIAFPTKVKGEKFISKSEVQAKVRQYVSTRESGQNYSYSILLESTGFKMAGRQRLQSKLSLSTSGRIKYFDNNMKKGLTKEIKRLMPSRYPLIFK